MNFFSSDAFLLPLARVAFTGRRTEVRHFRLGDHSYRLLSVDGVPLVQFPFMDFVEPARAALPEDPEVAWLPVAADEKAPAEQYRPAPDAQAAPTVELRRFETTDKLWQHVHQLNGCLASEDRRVRRKLEQKFGPIRIELNDPRPEAFSAALRWKSAKYRATGLPDRFEDPMYGALFAEMYAEGTLQLSTLNVGEQLIAVHLGMRDGKRFYSWIPGYDHAFARYSPGRQLFRALLEESHARGDEEFDFLIGDEPYKWHYATSYRPVRELGQAPLSVRAQRTLKTSIKATLQATGLWEPAQRWRLTRRG